MEAETLLGKKITSLSDFESAPGEIFDTFGCATLLKGGHFSQENDGQIVDVIWTGNGDLISVCRERIDVPDLHGTGCTLSAAITAVLAKGEKLEEAISQGGDYLTICMRNYFQWTSKTNSGVAALNHFQKDTRVY